MLNIQQLSYWERKTFLEEIDFLIIGAGIVGYSTALHLRKKHPNSKILIVERGFLPTGASSKNAGFACFGSATELLDDLDKMPEEKVWATVQKRWEGLHFLREIIGDTKMDFQQHGSWDIVTPNQKNELAETREKLNYLNQKTAEITGEKIVYFEDQSCAEKFGFANITTAFHNKLEGQINTGKMIRTFYQLAIENDIDVLFGLEVEKIERNGSKVLVQTQFGEISTHKLLICTNGFASQFIEDDVKPARAQVLVTKPIENLQLKGTFHYDAGYYYFRNIENRILLGGGRNLDFEGETTTEMRTTEQIINSLKNLLSTVILPNQNFEIEYQWAGIMGVGAEKQPIVKKIDENVAAGVRLGGMGVAIGSLVGKELAELV